MPIRFPVKITVVDRVGDSLLLVTAQADSKFPRVKPGQFFHLAIDAYQADSHWPESRTFSLASTSENGEFRFIISRSGWFAERLWQAAEVNVGLWLKGPYGELDIELEDVPTSSDLVFVAAGSGISPFSSLITKRIANVAEGVSSVSLLYSARSPALLTEREFYEELSVLHPAVFNVKFFVTRVFEKASGICAIPRRIQGEDVVRQIRDVSSGHVFLSGPSNLVITLRDYCVSSGIPAQNTHFDDWG